ncbi:MAG TPA: hypothetical protein VGA69_10145 [Nitriliruptorales bacterium]
MEPPSPDAGADAWTWPADETDAAGDRTGRRWLLLASATVPWIVVLALLVRPGPVAVRAAEPLGTPAATPSSSPTAGPPATTTTHAPEDLDPDPMTLTASSSARHTPDVGDAITTAVLVARAWFSGPGPTAIPVAADLAGDHPGYVEHLWVEAVDAPWRGQVVVTLGLLVLEPHGDELVPTARRLAVPVQLDRAGARAAGAPYLLPDPTVSFDPLAFQPVDDPDAANAAVDALTDAGYAVTEVVSLARSDGWPWAVTFVGSALDGSEPAERTVWLRPHLGAFVVAGWLPVAPDEAREVAP